ncbi:TPA: hypothetical protein ACJI3N_005352, partial [Raoultella planticola]
LQAPDSVRRYQMEMLVDKIFPNLPKAKKDKVEADIESYPPKEIKEDLQTKEKNASNNLDNK